MFLIYLYQIYYDILLIALKIALDRWLIPVVFNRVAYLHWDPDDYTEHSF